MAYIFNSTPPFTLSDGTLQTEGGVPIDLTLRKVQDQDANNSALQIATNKVKAESSEQCPLEVESTGTGGGIALLDATTTDNDSVGIGALGDALCFRSGGVPQGNMRLLDDGTLTLFGNKLRNFSAHYQSGGSINITSANSDDLNATVYAITGAFTIDIDDSVPDGFSLTIYQVDSSQCTITASGTLTLRNRLGHTQSAGQYAVISVIRIGLDLVLTGDTA